VLSERLLDVQETERRTISRELHDELGQALTAVKLNLQGIRRASGAAIGGALDDSIEIVERAITSARDLSLQLRPSLLDDLGLAAALRWYADRVARRSELEAQVTAQLPETRLPSALETACFRIAQEAVTNVARHAHATRFTVNLRQEAGALLLTVSDDGRGFDVAAVMRTPADGRSLGLVGMAERANLAGGELVIDSSPQRGTTVVVRVPLAPPG
jgi:signal transduction histidine kinase